MTKMKKISILLMILSLGIVSCKNDKKQPTNDSPTKVDTAEKFIV